MTAHCVALVQSDYQQKAAFPRPLQTSKYAVFTAHMARS